MKIPDIRLENFVCPLPIRNDRQIVIGHGSGGRMSKLLIDTLFNKYFNNPILNRRNDFAEILLNEEHKGHKLVISTDAHIIKPIFFPGGDIGRLAISGTVNDICMSGGIPKYITAAFILEEGLLLDDLESIIRSMHETAEEAGVDLVAGDTKVVEKGKADNIFISTTGVGFVNKNLNISGQSAKPGDSVIISGTIGDHGIAVLSAREQLGFKTTIQSDVAPLNDIIQSIITAGADIHVLRDPTRGGLATTLNELALQSQVSIQIDESSIPIKKEVRSACEMLGFDPLYIANEGKVVIILPSNQSAFVLELLRKHLLGRDAAVIGSVSPPEKSPSVIMRTMIGGFRIVDMLSGEILPRIC